MFSDIKETPSIQTDFLKGFSFGSPSSTSRPKPTPKISNTATIHGFLIKKGADKALIQFFRSSGKTFQEKCLVDSIRNEVPWTKKCNFERYTIPWCDNGQEMTSSSGYPIRLFVIPLLDIPSNENIFNLARFIVQNINADPNNYNDAIFDEKGYWWSQPGHWQNVIDTKASLRRIRNRCGESTGEDWWRQHAQTVLSHFATGTMSSSLIKVLHAPNNMMDSFFPEDSDTSDNEDLPFVISGNNDNNNDGEDINDNTNPDTADNNKETNDEEMEFTG